MELIQFLEEIPNYLENKAATVYNNGRRVSSLELNLLKKKMQFDRENNILWQQYLILSVKNI